jgi:heptosyltransferase-1
MAESRFLLVRLSSMGDVLHALPAASALRDAFPQARIDWAVDSKWARLLEGNPDLTEVTPLDRKSAAGIVGTVRKMRSVNYSCAIDFQGLYKSALLAFASGVPQRVGFASSYALEGLASFFYTDRLNPRGAHKVDHNLTLAGFVGTGKSKPRFPLAIRPEDDDRVSRELAARDLADFFVLNPGGGWRSKCWPATRYGELHRRLSERYGWRGVVTFGPGEEDLPRQVVDAADEPQPCPIPLDLGPLMSLMRRAKFVVSADTGPLHLAAALGAPVVGLFGPTDPSRNGPYSAEGGRSVVVRNPQNCETTYRRGASYAPSMLSITVEQAVDAVARLLESRP